MEISKQEDVTRNINEVDIVADLVDALAVEGFSFRDFVDAAHVAAIQWSRQELYFGNRLVPLTRFQFSVKIRPTLTQALYAPHHTKTHGKPE